LRWIVVCTTSVEETIGDDLIDDFALEVGSGCRSYLREQDREEELDNVQML